MYSNDIPVSVSVYEILWCDSSKRVLFRGTLLFLTTFVQNELQSSCFFILIFVNVWINVLNPSREYHDELLRISLVDNSYMYLFFFFYRVALSHKLIWSHKNNHHKTNKTRWLLHVLSQISKVYITFLFNFF